MIRLHANDLHHFAAQVRCQPKHLALSSALVASVPCCKPRQRHSLDFLPRRALFYACTAAIAVVSSPSFDFKGAANDGYCTPRLSIKVARSLTAMGQKRQPARRAGTSGSLQFARRSVAWIMEEPLLRWSIAILPAFSLRGLRRRLPPGLACAGFSTQLPSPLQ